MVSAFVITAAGIGRAESYDQVYEGSVRAATAMSIAGRSVWNIDRLHVIDLCRTGVNIKVGTLSQFKTKTAYPSKTLPSR